MFLAQRSKTYNVPSVLLLDLRHAIHAPDVVCSNPSLPRLSCWSRGPVGVGVGVEVEVEVEVGVGIGVGVVPRW